MKQLDRYIGGTILANILLVLGLFVLLNSVFGFVHEVSNLSAGYQFWQALEYTLIRVPRGIYMFTPVACLIGPIVGLGSMAGNSELVVMRAAGVSIAQISWAVLRPVLLVVMVNVLIGEFVAPIADQMAKTRRALAENEGKALNAQYAQWYREGDEFIHLNAVEPNGVVYGVTRYHFDDTRLTEADFSRRGIYQREHWFMEDVEQTRIFPKHTEVEMLKSQAWDTSITPALLNLVVLNPALLPMNGLWKYGTYREEQGLAAGPYFLAFWQKLFQPLVTAAMAFVAISFIFGPLRSVTTGARVMAGVATGLGLHYGQEFFGQLSVVFGLPSAAAAFLPVVVCLLIGCWAMRRSG